MRLFDKKQALPPDDREHTICNTGHRPQSLPWGFDEKNRPAWLSKLIYIILLSEQ